ncbi:MAG: dipeptidase PepE [Bacteroidales bacterium]|nr:dipeptidase PepE [Bacteroidales bacterium]
MKLLLISNSTNPGKDYLGWTLPFLEDFLKNNSITTALFVPYAGVNVGKPQTLKESYDNLFGRAQGVFKKFGVELASIHQAENAVEAVQNAECVIVSGGNTFHLVYELHRNKVMDVLRNRAKEGMPYIGWSAGSNVACPTLRTTNDMPIIEPESFNCLNLVPFQINPHYLDTEKHPVDFGGETREERINEFMAVNKDVTIIGLRESSLLEINGNTMILKAQEGIEHGIRVFRYGKDPEEVPQGDVSKFIS